MKNKASHLIDTIILISFLSLVPALLYWSPTIALVYLLSLTTIDVALQRAQKKHTTKERHQRFTLLLEEFKRTQDCQVLKPALEESSFQLLFCLYEDLGAEAYNQLDLSALSTMKFKIDPLVVRELGEFFKMTKAEFEEVEEAEFLGRFLHFFADRK